MSTQKSHHLQTQKIKVVSQQINYWLSKIDLHEVSNKACRGSWKKPSRNAHELRKGHSASTHCPASARSALKIVVTISFWRHMLRLNNPQAAESVNMAIRVLKGEACLFLIFSLSLINYLFCLFSSHINIIFLLCMKTFLKEKYVCSFNEHVLNSYSVKHCSIAKYQIPQSLCPHCSWILMENLNKPISE
jgi:hypothetical protein